MIDIAILFVYFGFLIAIGWAFRKFSSNTSDYFRGGGKMLWWMVGSTSFMTAVSAMTFTGHMGKSLTGGFAVAIVVFYASALGFLCNYLFFAAKARQMRVITPLEGVRMRYGRINEQIMMWSRMPLGILQAAIWVNALGVFASAVVGVPLEVTIVVTGSIVVFMSLIGGSWAVIASDFMQMVILTVMTLVTGLVALWKGGGVVELMSNGLPENPIIGDGYNYTYLFVGWFLCMFIKQFLTTNNMLSSYRYITAKDTKNARKAALLAASLMLVGPLVWFLPVWFVSGHYPDPSTWGITELGNKVTDATYYIFVKREMPVGMIGMLLAAIFAATMSSMDSGLNGNSGIVIKSIYQPYINKGASEKHLLKVGKMLTAAFGVVIILAALGLSSLRQYGLFDLTMLINTLIGFPILIPALLGFYIKKTPEWAVGGTILVGMCVSATIAFVITPEMIASFLNLDQPLTNREFTEMKSVTLGVIGHGVITLPFFVCSQFFYKGLAPEREKNIEKFFSNVATEVVVEDTPESIELDNKQCQVLGKMILVAAGFILLLTLVPNPLWGRMIFLFMAMIVAGIGVALLKAVKKPDYKLSVATD